MLQILFLGRLWQILALQNLFFTEFVNVDGLQSPGRGKLLPKLRFADKEHPIIAQIWGKTLKNYKPQRILLLWGMTALISIWGALTRQ